MAEEKGPAVASYLDELERQRAAASGARAQTRARILLCVAQVLSSEGYHDAIVRQVCEQLGLSRGAFSNYFENRTDAVAEVLNGFCRFVFEMSVGVGRGKSDFERINEVTLFYFQLYQRNKGLFAVQYKLARDKSAYSEGWRELQDNWRGRLARYIVRVTKAEETALQSALALSYMLTSLADDFLYRLIFEDEEQLRWLKRHPRRVAALISVVWYRAIFGRDPAAALEPDFLLKYSGVLPVAFAR
jgi:AcrR family transcriptional regulator